MPGVTVHTLVALAFAAATAVCWAAVPRARRLDDPDTRRGLVWLLLASGGWAAAHVTFLLAPVAWLGLAGLYGGLLLGLAAVGAWLYFCSAYTGRRLHRSPGLRRAALGCFLVLAAVKLTNPLHGLYVTTTADPHLVVHRGPLHWAAMGLAYTLAGVGAFMLLERFASLGRSAAPLAGVVGLAGLPAALDLLAVLTPAIPDVGYEPLGVAAFAVGALGVHRTDLRRVRLSGDPEEPVVVLDAEDRVRTATQAAQALVSGLDTGTPIGAVGPDGLDPSATPTVVELEGPDGEARAYRVVAHRFGAGAAGAGRVLALSDVTDRERDRRRLERQNQRLDRFARTLSHDLRNPLSVASGNLELARTTDDPTPLDRASTALGRMEALIDGLLDLAREGEAIGEPAPVALGTAARQAWGLVATESAELVVADDLTIAADTDRLQQLLANLFRNAIDHGDDGVTVTVGALADGTGFYVADDGPGVPPGERDRLFDLGYSPGGGTGIGLAIVRDVAEAHGWTCRLTDAPKGGARFECAGVEVVDASSAVG